MQEQQQPIRDADISHCSEGIWGCLRTGAGLLVKIVALKDKRTSSLPSHWDIKPTHTHRNTSGRNPKFCSLCNLCQNRSDRELCFLLNANQFPDVLCQACFSSWPGGWCLSEFSLLLWSFGAVKHFFLPLHLPHCSACLTVPNLFSLFYSSSEVLLNLHLSLLWYICLISTVGDFQTK